MDLTAAHPQLPEPALTLSLPSIHDGTLLDCRVYLPSSIVAGGVPSSGASSSSARPVWRGDAAVVAHPYAPLGGSYNDPIVRLVAHTLLTRGQFVVATFNFRGASSGKGAGGGSGSGGVGSWSTSHRSGRKDKQWGVGGRTSWTAKPETADYMTVVGFLYYFVHVLDPYGQKAEAAEAADAAAGAQAATTPQPHAAHRAATFLCAGYSYGAMVTSLLPPLDAVLAHFVRPRRGSPAAAVRWRAARWAAIQNADLTEMREAAAAASGPRGGSLRGEARLSMGVRVGGGETPRRSHDVGARKSLDAVWRRSGEHHHSHHAATAGGHSHRHRHRHRMAGLVARVVAGRTRSSSSGSIGSNSSDDGGAGGVHKRSDAENDSHFLPVVPGLPAVRPAYLLVSPPVGLATRLATMSWGGGVGGVGGGGGGGGGDAVSPTRRDDGTPESKLTANPTLVVYGGADGFVSHRTMRQWTARLTGASLLHRHRNRSAVGAAGSGTLGTLGALGTQSQGQDRAPDRALFRALVVQAAGHFWVEGRTLYELEAAVRAFIDEVLHDRERQTFIKTATEPTTTERRPGVRPVSATG